MSKPLHLLHLPPAQLHMRTSLQYCVRERSEKYFPPSACQVLYHLIETNTYTLHLPVCNSGLYNYVMGLYNPLPVLQDMTDRTDSQFKRIAPKKNLLLIGS